MLEKPDVWDIAQRLVASHGSSAPARAESLSTRYLAAGDRGQALTWRFIADASQTLVSGQGATISGASTCRA